MNSGMNGQQAGKRYEAKWEQWLRDVRAGEVSWPMAEGKVSISEFVKLSGISRNVVYKNPSLAPKIKAEIEKVNAATLNAASQRLRSAEERDEKCVNEKISTITAKYVKREDYEDLKRKYEGLEQKLAVVEPAYYEAVKRIKELELELNQYEFQFDTGFVARAY